MEQDLLEYVLYSSLSLLFTWLLFRRVSRIKSSSVKFIYWTPVVRRILILVVGWFFLILGVIGLFLPILQGFLFLAIGLAILSKESETANRILKWLKRKYPQPYARFTLLKRKILRRFSRNSDSHDREQDE